jgi:putative solute:sodium symporter small subunit
VPPIAGTFYVEEVDYPSQGRAGKRVCPHSSPHHLNDMQPTGKRKQYWHKNLRLTAGLLAVWFAVTFVAGWFARDMHAIVLFGFPLSFYVAAQGALLVYVILVGYYAYRMNRLDREHGVEEEP